MNNQKLKNIFEAKDHAGVRQDKDTPGRIYKALRQPQYATTPAYIRPLDSVNTNSARSQNVTPAQIRPKHHGSDKRQLIEVAGCVPKHIAEQLERMRDQGGKGKLSRSSVVAAIITKGVQRNVDMQYGATLEPVIETTIKRAMNQSIRNDIKRAGDLALEAFYSSEETRVISIYILRFLMGEDIKLLPQIIKEVHEQARANVNRVLSEGNEDRKGVNEQN